MGRIDLREFQKIDDVDGLSVGQEQFTFSPNLTVWAAQCSLLNSLELHRAETVYEDFEWKLICLAALLRNFSFVDSEN